MSFTTNQPAQMTGLEYYQVNPLFTIGETFKGYTPPGILDGIGAFEVGDNGTVRVLVNHELPSNQGYAYTLVNGTSLPGSRVSYFDINPITFQIEDTGLAYNKIINRAGEVVDAATDLEFGGINRLCSAQYVAAGTYGFLDGIFFTGEETNGGTEFALDVRTRTLYAVPWMGRAGWENVTPLDTGTKDKVALLIGDDRAGKYLLMYVGQKNAVGDGSFLDRNGLAQGKLYTWVADSGETTPEQFNGTSASRDGKWVEIQHYNPAMAGQPGYDSLGFANQATQDTLAKAAGGFEFSRPEDVATNPADGTVAVLASTGRGSLFPSDNWGTTYIIDTDFDASGTPISGDIKIIYDGDDAGNGQFAGPDFGLRSPDNLDWSADGFIYLQEDRSTEVDQFGATSGEEASIWKLDPATGQLTRISQMDRSGVPTALGQTDPVPNEIGNWESSGILDISKLFGLADGKVMIFDVQAHSLRDGTIATENLVQGGQLSFLVAPELGTAGRDELTGSNLGEMFVGYAGKDIITTKAGKDTIVYTSRADRGDTITDFEVGVDKIDLRPLLDSISYLGSDPFADGVVNFRGSALFIDPDGSAGPMKSGDPLLRTTGVQLSASDILV